MNKIKLSLTIIFFIFSCTSLSLKAQSQFKQSKVFSDKAYGYLKNQDYHNALKYLEQAISLNPKNDEAFFYMGDCYFHKDDAKALANYKKSALLFGSNYLVFTRIGVCYMRLKQYNLAFQNFDKAIECAKEKFDIGDAYFQRAHARVEILDWQGALKDVNTSLKNIEQSNGYLYSLRGRVLLNLEKYEEALADLNSAIERNHGEDFWDYLNRGKVYLKMNRKDKACSDFELAYRLNKNADTYEAITTNCRIIK